MPHRRDIGTLLIEQLQELIGDIGKVALTREKPWASITFSGTRHYVQITCRDIGVCEALAKRLHQLPETEFDLPGHFVADLLIRDYDKGDPTVALETLTIIDPVSPERIEPIKS